MATSIFHETKKILTLRAKGFCAAFVIVLMTFTYASAQSYLVPVDAPNNIYPITFTDAAQRILILEFDRAVTSSRNFSRLDYNSRRSSGCHGW